MKAYSVHYYLNGIYEQERYIIALASNKDEAYVKAVFDLIPEKEGRQPYAAWVDNVTYNNGNVHYFNGTY